MELHNKELHDNLIALGYENYERSENGDDQYRHLDNDDWFAINKKGHINPMDCCEYTEGSVRGQSIMKEKGAWEFMNIHETN